MSSRYNDYDRDYDNSYDNYSNNGRDNGRSNQRSRKSRVVDIPDDQLSSVRRRELDSFYSKNNSERSLMRIQTAPEYDSEGADDNDDRYSRQGDRRQQRSVDDNYMRSSGDRNKDDYYRRSRRRDYSPAPSGYDGGSSRGAGRQSQSGRSRRAQSEAPNDQQLQRYQSRGQGRDQGRNQGQDQDQGQGQGGGRNQDRSMSQGQNFDPNRPTGQGGSGKQQRMEHIPFNKDVIDTYTGDKMWVSVKQRKDGTLLERTFDSSYDGLLAAAAGAAIGAITVRRMQPFGKTEEENIHNSRKRRGKMIAGALVGGAAFNAGENWFRVYTEENSERAGMMAVGAEFLGEGIDNLVV